MDDDWNMLDYISDYETDSYSTTGFANLSIYFTGDYNDSLYPSSDPEYIRVNVSLQVNESGQYNIQYYLEKQILPAIENIFQVFNINVKEIIDGKKQMCLSDF